MVDFEDPPNPPGSPVEKIQTARERLLEPVDVRDYLHYRSEADPQMERILAGALEEYDRRKNENMMRWLDEEEKWLNRHVHAGGLGGSPDYLGLMETLGPLYWWRMEEVNGDTVAHSGISSTERTLKLTNTTLDIDGAIGSGLWLPGGTSSDPFGRGLAWDENNNEESSVNISNVDPTNKITICGWVKFEEQTETIGGGRILFSLFSPTNTRNGTLQLGHSGDISRVNRLRMGQKNPNIAGSTPYIITNEVVTDAQWHFFLCGFQFSEGSSDVPIELWLNGSLHSTDTVPATDGLPAFFRVGATRNLFPGPGSGSDAEPFEIDELAIFAGWLEPMDIQALYQSGIQIVRRSLV